jgi:hypothetical protein
MKYSKAEVHRKTHGLPALRFEDNQLTSFSGLGSSPDFVDTVVPQTAIVSYWTGDRYPKDE